jgi:hypothetical protein
MSAQPTKTVKSNEETLFRRALELAKTAKNQKQKP